MPAAVLILCQEPPTTDQILMVQMVRRIAHADAIQTEAGPGIIAILDQDMREEDFGNSVLPTLQEFRFAKDVEPVRGGYSRDMKRNAYCQAILDLVNALRPSPPVGGDEAALMEYVDAAQEWDRLRNILLRETWKSIHSGEPVKA